MSQVYQPGIKINHYYLPIKHNKLCVVWDRPYEVLKMVSGTTCLLRTKAGKEFNWHIDLLKPVGRTVPNLFKVCEMFCPPPDQSD